MKGIMDPYAVKEQAEEKPKEEVKKEE